MSQSENAMIGKLANVINDENYYYIGVKASPFAIDCAVFGLNPDEVSALSKRFPNSGTNVLNGVMIKGPPFSIINALAELGYRVVCSTGETEILWTMQREL
ncbi:PREDICTED: uncharacterized protein LOC108555796 isoform X2 [Eufriesea mexicana]|nr:PREDICTED: uncharacterized protein LOC108555796 isoform X2 [Eufriesea mexicana]